MRSISRALLVPQSEWKRILLHQDDIKKMGGIIHQDEKNKNYAFIFSSLAEASEADLFLRNRASISASMINADDLSDESFSMPRLVTNHAPEEKPEHKPLVTFPDPTLMDVSLDRTPLTGETLSTDSKIIFSSTEARDPSHWCTNHTLDDKSQLVITHLAYSKEINEFEYELVKKGLVGESKDLLTRYESKNISDFMLPILVRFKFIIENKSKLKNLSTRRQFIIIANLMANCHKLMACGMGMPDMAKKKYESIFNLDWSIFSLYASLISYNYVVDDKKSIRFPVHHKLVLVSMNHILDADIPEIYEMLCQMYDIEMCQIKPTHAPISERFNKDATVLTDVIRFMEDVKKYNKDIAKLGLGVKLTGINQMCQVTGNYYHLQSILKIIERAKKNGLSSYREKVALLSCLIQVGELIKKLSPELQKQVNTINWESFKIVRDCLEHPDEAGRNEVINKLLENGIEGAHLSMIRQELEELSINIQAHVLDRFYKIPGQALLEDQQGKLFAKIPPAVEHKIPPQFKLDSKEKEKIYNLATTNKDYWQRVFAGTRYLTDEAIRFLTTNEIILKELIEKIWGIDESLIDHSLVKWSKKYNLSSKGIKNFLIMAKKIGVRDVFIQMLEGADVSLSDQKITEFLEIIEKISSPILLDSYPLELKEALIKAVTDFGSAKDFFHSMIKNIASVRPIERVFRAFRAVSVKYVPDMNLKEIAAFAIKYLKHLGEMLHDKLHTPEFTNPIFSRLHKLMSDEASLGWLTPDQQNIVKTLMQRYPDTKKIPKREFDRFVDIWIESGIHAATELHLQTSAEEGLAIKDSYAEIYGKNIDAILLHDSIFREEMYFYLSVIFGLTKKLMEVPKTIPEEIIPFLQELKTYRNFLGHLDDHVASIVGDPDNNIVRLGACVDNMLTIMKEVHKTLSRRVDLYRFPDEDEPRMKRYPKSCHEHLPPLTGHSASLYAARDGARALSILSTARDSKVSPLKFSTPLKEDF